MALSPVFTSCEKDKDKPTVTKSLVGEWEIETFKLDGVDYKGTVVVESQIQFKAEKDGDADFKWFISYSDGDSETIRGEYEVDENDKVIELHPTGGNTLELEFATYFIQLIHPPHFIVMKTNHLLAISLLFVTLWLANCGQKETAETETPAATAETMKRASVSRGEYLVNAMGCDDCHTPKTMTPQGPAPDLTRRFMGHPANEPFESADKKNLIETQHVAVFSPGMTAAAGPWGVSFAANISPDDTGIGAWTEAQFFKAIREGRSKGLDGTRPLLPPMPWPTLAKLTDEDLRAIFNYLKTATPMKNVVPQPKGL